MGLFLMPSWGSSKSAPRFLLFVGRLRLLFLTSCLLPLSQTSHTLRFTHLPPKRTDPLTFSLDHTQTLSQSEVFAISSFILRLRHRPTHTQTHSGHSHSEIPSHSAYSHSGPCTQGIPRGAARGYLYSQPDHSHPDSPNIKLTHTQADSYSNQPILMWQA